MYPCRICKNMCSASVHSIIHDNDLININMCSQCTTNLSRVKYSNCGYCNNKLYLKECCIGYREFKICPSCSIWFRGLFFCAKQG